jgi:hypothetical protein
MVLIVFTEMFIKNLLVKNYFSKYNYVKTIKIAIKLIIVYEYL